MAFSSFDYAYEIKRDGDACVCAWLGVQGPGMGEPSLSTALGLRHTEPRAIAASGYRCLSPE